MLVLMGRGFDAAAFRRDVAATKAGARGARGTAYTDAARAGWGELMELAGIAAGLVLAVGALVVLVGLVLQVWVVRHPGLPGDVVRWAARLAGWLGRRAGPR